MARFRWAQWRALPAELRWQKLWGVVRRRILRWHSPPAGYALHAPELLLCSGAIGRALEVPEERLPLLKQWAERLRRHEFLLFLPCWIPRSAPSAPALDLPEPIRSEALRLARHCTPGYHWVDWHTDPLARPPKRGCEDPTQLGPDPKVPWELGRLQHLPALALLARWALLRREDAYAAELRTELQNQLLDFLAANPPGLGIQWDSPLEVALRLVSLAMVEPLLPDTLQLERAAAAALHRSIYEHGMALMHTLEWREGLRGNHYLGNLLGLLVAGAVLDKLPLADAWLAFALRELITEVLQQFLPDGGNWEGSLFYHRFALEMVLVATALVLNLPPSRRQALAAYDERLWAGERPLPPAPVAEFPHPRLGATPFPTEYWQRLSAAVHLLQAVEKPDGTAPQIGDHDSGRALKLLPELEPLPAQQAATFRLPDGLHPAELWEQPRRLRPTLALASLLCPQLRTELPSPEAQLLPSVEALECSAPSNREHFPHFGLTVLRVGPFWLAIRCGGVESLHPSAGHAHCDQLSFELCVGSDTLIADPGTYCYTDARWRNHFRATAAHNTLVVQGSEQFRFYGHSREALFWMFRDRASARTLQCSEREFVGEFRNRAYWHRRHLRLGESWVEGTDTYEASAPAALHFHFAPEVEVRQESSSSFVLRTPGHTLRLELLDGAGELHPALFSGGYRLLQSTLQLRVVPTTATPAFHWRLELL